MYFALLFILLSTLEGLAHSPHRSLMTSNREKGMGDRCEINHSVSTDDNSSITVYDGTDSDEGFPIYGSLSYSLVKTQFIIPSTDLTNISEGSYISRLIFYAKESAVDWGQAKYQVFVGSTDKELLTWTGTEESFVSWNGLTMVYEGRLSVVGNTMDIVFDTPYQYQGGNMVIGVYQTVKGSGGNENTVTWYGQNYSAPSTTHDYPALYSYSNQCPGITHRAKTTIVYSTDVPSNMRPTDFACTLTPGDGYVATLGWTENGSATTWEICLNNDEANPIVANSNPFTLTGLTPETRYTAKVRSVNGEDRSLWSEPVSFKPTDYYWVTVNNGTDTHDDVPVHGNLAEYKFTNSQFVIPSGELSDISSGCYINRLTFYADKNNANWGDAKYKVYVDLVSWQTFIDSDKIPINPDDTPLTCVYEGTLSVSDYEMEITFDNPFQYQPGSSDKNLLISVRQTTAGTSNTCNWYGASQSGNTAIGGFIYDSNQSSPSDLTFLQFLPKTTIGYLLENPKDIKTPKHLKVSYTGGDNAVVSWESTETAWDIKVNDKVSDVVTENVTSPYTLRNLAFATDYEVSVRSRRDGDGTAPVVFSDWTAPVSFRTDLAADGCQIGFYLTDARGDGWTGNAIRVVDVETGWEIATVANDSDTPAGEEQLIVVDVPKNRSFRLEWVSGENPEDCSWRVLDANSDEITSSAAGGASSFEDGYEIVVASTDCVVSDRWKKPTNLTVRPYLTMAEISWTDNSNPAATSWILAYKKIGEKDFTDEKWPETIPYTLYGLEPNTTYIVKVRPYSGDDRVAKWSKEVTFTMYGEYMVPSDLKATTSYDQATLSWSGNSSQYEVKYRKAASFFEDFKNGIPSDWTTIDADGDGYGWFNYIYELSSEYEEGEEEEKDPELVIGQSYPASESYNDENGELTPDNWLITPLMPLQGRMKVRLRSQYVNYDEDENPIKEKFAIYVSTTSNSDSDFTQTLLSETIADENFADYPADLSSYSGQLGYIAIRHFNTTDALRILLDNFGLYEENDDESGWATVTVNSPEALVEHLDGNSIYEVKVKGINSDQPAGTDWSAVATFTSYDLVIADDKDKSSVYNGKSFEKYAGNTVAVELGGRTLYKDGTWNTLCLPFSLSEAQLASSPLAGAVIRKMDDAVMTGTHVDITFTDVTEIEAGEPYIIKWKDTGDNIVNPVFHKVVITAVEPHTVTSTDGCVNFVGYYDTFSIDASNDDIYYMDANNTFRPTSKARNLWACRAYLQFTPIDGVSVKDLTFNINFSDDEATFIHLTEKENMEGSWYTLQGMKLSGKPVMPGIYIHNGKKIMIKEERGNRK